MAMGTSKGKKPKVAAKPKQQHEPTAEERDERVSLHPADPEDVLRHLLHTPAPREDDKN
jgi:hypothetical protein